MQEIRVSSVPWTTLLGEETRLTDDIIRAVIHLEYPPEFVLSAIFQDVNKHMPFVNPGLRWVYAELTYDGIIVDPGTGATYITPTVISAVEDDFTERLNNHEPAAYATLLFALGYEVVIGYDNERKVVAFPEATFLLFGRRSEFYTTGGFLGEV